MSDFNYLCELAKLLSRMGPYLRHKNDCGWHSFPNDSNCTCGFVELIRDIQNLNNREIERDASTR